MWAPPPLSGPPPHLAGVHAALGQAGTQHPLGDLPVVGGQVAALVVYEFHLRLLQGLRQFACVKRGRSEGSPSSPPAPSPPASGAGGHPALGSPPRCPAHRAPACSPSRSPTGMCPAPAPHRNRAGRWACGSLEGRGEAQETSGEARGEGAPAQPGRGRALARHLAARCALGKAPLTRGPLPPPGELCLRQLLLRGGTCHLSPETRRGDRSFTRAMSLSLGDAGVTSARKTFSTARVAVPERRSEPAFTRQL